MYYFVIYQSSITEYYDTEKKYLTSFFWGTIAYIFTHAFLTSTNIPLLVQLYKSFWLLIAVDIGVMIYMYYNIKNKDSLDNSLVDTLLSNLSIKIPTDEPIPDKSKLDQTPKKIIEEQNSSPIIEDTINVTIDETLNSLTTPEDIEDIQVSSTPLSQLIEDDEDSGSDIDISAIDEFIE